MQNAAFAAMGLNSTYIAFRVPPNELKESIESLKAIRMSGFNVTIPHKVEVMKYLDELDATARKVGAVNTVNNIEGILKGYNTDMHGFIEPLHRRKVSFDNMTILLLGAGGAARAIVAALAQEKRIGKVVIANRDQKRGGDLAHLGSGMGLKCEAIAFDDAASMSQDAGMIVNSTSIGLENEPSPLTYEQIKKGTIVYDIVYRPVVTDLIENGKAAGAHIVYGYEMLLEQGAKAFEIWTGLPAPRDAMKKNLLGIFGEPT
jgi:shikimate dehydrogenase